jgi:ribosomal-protein-alanine N-acetyltransferase
MILMTHSTFGRAVPRLETERLLLTIPGPERAQAIATFNQQNRAHFAPSVPERPEAMTPEYWRQRLTQAARGFEPDGALHFFLFERRAPEGAVVGECALTGIVRGPFHAAYLGYKLSREYEGRGLMTEALKVAIAYAFERMQLHRIMANYRPENERSGRLLRRLGFIVEGYARDYLFLAGSWRDHVLTSLTNASFDVTAMGAPPA